MPHQEHPGLCGPGQIHQTRGRGMYYILRCEGLFHVSSSGSFHLHHQAHVGTGYATMTRDIHVHTTLGILPLKCLFLLPRQLSWTGKGASHGIAHQSHCGQPVHVKVWNQGHQLSPHPLWLWLRNVEDTFVIQKTEHSNLFLQHINSIDPYINFTEEAADH